MRTSLYATAFLAIAATLGVKVSTGGTPVLPDRAESTARLAALLKSAGFEAVPLRGEVPLEMTAWRRSDCEMLAGVVNLIGAEDRLVKQIVPPGWTATYVFANATYAAAPKAAAITRDYINRARWIFDESVGFEPIMVAVHQPGCDLTGVPWQAMDRAGYRRRAFAG